MFSFPTAIVPGERPIELGPTLSVQAPLVASTTNRADQAGPGGRMVRLVLPMPALP